MFDFDIHDMDRPSLTFRMDDTWYEAREVIDSESGSWRDLKPGPVAILFDDWLGLPTSSRSIKGVVASVIELTDDVIYLTHKLCVRLLRLDQQDDIHRVPETRVIANSQVWCIG